LHHPCLVFVEENLKDHLHDTLKELKIGTNNEEGLERATLQCDEVLERLNAIDGHATRNVLKKCQSLLDGPPVSTVMGMKITNPIGFLKPRQEQKKVKFQIYFTKHKKQKQKHMCNTKIQ